LAEETQRIKHYEEQKEAEAAGRQTKRAEESAAKEHVQSESSSCRNQPVQKVLPDD